MRDFLLGDRRSIGGVTADFRADRFTKSCSWLFMPLTDEEIAEDDTDFHVKIAVRVNPSADHDFPEFFVKQMEKQLSIDRSLLRIASAPLTVIVGKIQILLQAQLKSAGNLQVHATPRHPHRLVKVKTREKLKVDLNIEYVAMNIQ